MVDKEKYIRKPHYFHLPDVNEKPDPERMRFLTNEMLVQIFSSPFLSYSRRIWGSFLWDLWHTDKPRSEGNYDSLDVLHSIEYLQGLLTYTGLVHGDEIVKLQDTRGEIVKIDPGSKYLSEAELRQKTKEWKDSELVIGHVGLSADPPHVGHAQLVATVWPHCDIMLVGIDSNKMLRLRKGEDRPRFPQLGWRLMEFASLPFADYVCINPLRSGSVGGQLDQEWRRVYSDLGITVVGVGPDNPLLNEYRRRMDDVGGRVIASGIRPNSSTELVGIASSDHPRKWTINMKVFQERANLENQLAVVLGFPAGE